MFQLISTTSLFIFNPLKPKNGKLHQKCIHNTSVFTMLKILIRIIACSALLFGLRISYLLETVTKTKGGSSCLDGGSLVKLLPSP